MSPAIVLALFSNYGIGGVIGALAGAYLALALLMALAGVETNRRLLEALDPNPAADAVQGAMLSPVRPD